MRGAMTHRNAVTGSAGLDIRWPAFLTLTAIATFSGCGVAEAPERVVPGLGDIHGPWSATPIPIPAPVAAAADRACRGMMQPFPQGVQLVVIDARGEGILQIAYAGPDGSGAQCNDMTVDQQGRVQAMGGGSAGQGDGQRLPDVPPNELQPGGSSRSGDPVSSSVTIGRAGRGIAAVGIIIPGQRPITASFANGWYLAWWPGEWPAGTTVIGLDSKGQKVVETTP